MILQFVLVPPVPKRVIEKEKPDERQSDEKVPSDGPDPSAPITRKGVLTSFLTGKPMEIPELDVVSCFQLNKLKFLVCVYVSVDD